MSETHEPQAAPVVKVAQDLRAIEELFEAVLVQAVHKANDRLMPGGEAMVALASVGSPREWEERIEAAEHYHLATCERLDHTRCRYAEHAADEDGHEPILQTLVFWTEQARGYDLDRRPTIATEVNFLRGWLNWAWDNLPEFDDFAKDVRSAKSRLENLLMAGERAERGAPCMYDECKGARVMRKLEPYRDSGGEKAWRWSDWHCPRCKRSWDEDRYAANVAAAHWSTQIEMVGDETWCSVKYAARQAELPESTIRAWVTQTKKQERPVDREFPIVTACVVLGRREGFVCLDHILARRDRPRGKVA
ncbi:hypothetical protein NOK12_16710 [Nocardioides sp. OK12]|uniref:hypothetical protein n=1 Tax=Nocardioides sp. OK12 TaxID=2758661 RepID=UPI0021C264A8|nr:hypothetical protein [Nocardioides sp. OK12]GHJ59153.1 hypothetical protein NOK12_16710 [Nocardioides sp. OK12]